MPLSDAPVFLLKSKELQQVILSLQSVMNGLDDRNMLAGGLSLDKLSWKEWPIALVAAGVPVSTTTSADCGGFLVFDPGKYLAGTSGKWYFEAAIRISDVAYTATAKLMNGATIVGSVSTALATYAVVRSAALTMPTAQATLTVKVESSNTLGTAYLWTARLIFAPQG